MPSIFTPTISYRPFAYPDLMAAVERHEIDMYWSTHQLDFLEDVKQYYTKDGLKTQNVSHKVNKEILTKTLNLFTQMDVAAGALYCQLLPYVENNEVRNWFMIAAARESTHQRAYAAAVEALSFPESTWTEFMEYSEMQDKIDLIMGGEDTDPSTRVGFMKTLARLFMAEGICLFGAFASMLNLRRYGLMQGTNKVNEWSLKDEEEHVKNNVMIFNSELENFTPAEREDILQYTQDIAIAYASAEEKFIDLVYGIGDQEGMTKGQLKEYIHYLTSVRLRQVGIKLPKETTKNPLEWMEWVLSGKKHTNFFEERVADYSHEKLQGDIDYKGYTVVADQETPLLGEVVGEIVIFSAEWCSYCDKLKSLLDNQEVSYKVIDVDDNEEEFKKLGVKTIPQVKVGGTLIGGYSDFIEQFC